MSVDPHTVAPLRDVLIVEDSLTQAFALKRFLQTHGFRTALANHGREALEILRKQPIEVVVSDINMPEMDGYEMCAAIKNDPALRRIPVILLTTLSDSENILQGLKAHADCYLTKPYDPNYLLGKIHEQLESPPPETVGGQEPPLEIKFNGRTETVTADRRLMLNLLLSTYENATQQNRELIRTQQELNLLNRKIQASETNFRALLQSSVDGVVVLDLQGLIRFVNPAAESLLGRAAADMLGTKFEFPTVAGEAREVEVLRDGQQIIAEMRTAQTDWEGKPAYLASLRDITQRKLDEQKIREQQAKLEEANVKLEALATLDGLTGLKNRRTFQERLADEVHRAQRYQIALSLLILDVDHFKQFNDTFGHPAGDEVLKSVAKLLRLAVRDTDFVARYGGEEFVVLMPYTDKDAAMKLAERLRGAIATAPWPKRAVTASFGVASLAGDCATETELLSQADKALYHSKRAGRNRVSHAQENLSN